MPVSAPRSTNPGYAYGEYSQYRQSVLKYIVGDKLSQSPIVFHFCSCLSHAGFELVPKSVIFNDFERRNGPYFALFHGGRLRQSG